MGTFTPVALQFAGSAAAQKVGLFPFFSIAIFIRVLKLKIILRSLHYSIKHERNLAQHFASEPYRTSTVDLGCCVQVLDIRLKAFLNE